MIDKLKSTIRIMRIIPQAFFEIFMDSLKRIRICEITNREGYLSSFWISSHRFPKKKIPEILMESDDVSDIQKPFFRSGESCFYFKFCGVEFVVYEPYAYAEYFYVGPLNDGQDSHFFSAKLKKLRRLFEVHPSYLIFYWVFIAALFIRIILMLFFD